jgi:hypothetical protein
MNHESKDAGNYTITEDTRTQDMRNDGPESLFFLVMLLAARILAANSLWNIKENNTSPTPE